MFELESNQKYDIGQSKQHMEKQQQKLRNGSLLMGMLNNLMSACWQGRQKLLQMEHSEQVEALAFDLQGAFLHMLSFGTLTKFSIDVITVKK